MLKRSALIPIPFVLIALSGCDGAGMVRSPDGQWITQNAANTRAVKQRTIADSLARGLGPHWRAEVAIAPDPVRDVDGDYRWSRADVRVDLVGDGQATLPESELSVEAGIRRYLSSQVDNARKNLTVTVTSSTDAARFALLAPTDPNAPTAPATRSAPAPSATAPAGSYVIQAGDTLAAISAAFYGSSQHWRRIAEANPGLDPGNLAAGAVIAIPPLP